MSAIERCGMLALGVAILMGAVLPTPWMTAGLHAPVSAVATPAPEALSRAPNSPGPRTRVTAPQPELILSVGRFRVSWSTELRALSWRLRSLAQVLCLYASAVRLVDYTGCRHRLSVALQSTGP